MEYEEKLKAILPEKEPVVQIVDGLRIPVCAPALGQEEGNALIQAFNSGFISGTGDYIEMFEEAFAKATGAKFGIAVNSGTSALHVAYRLMGIKPGDEVIIPTFTMVSTATPLIEMGAIPVFVECDAAGQIDTTKIEEKITDRTVAIVGVHIYGHPCDIDAIEHIAVGHGLKTMYDCAEAHGALYKGKKLGEYGTACAYSFYANKVITTGEGGMVTVNDEGLKKRADRLIDEYFSEERHFWHEDYGYSYRLNNLSCAIGLAQTKKLEDLIKMRRANWQNYKDQLADVPGISFLPERPDVVSVRWMIGILVDRSKFGMNKNHLREKLAQFGIETRTFFIPMHLQPVMQQFHPEYNPEFSQSEILCRDGMYLPSSSTILESTIRRVTDRIWRIQREGV